MVRFRDAVLVAPLLIAGQALAGTPIANSSGVDISIPNLVPIPVVEPTPAAGAASVPASPSAGKAVVREVAAGSRFGTPPFETLIADFRWGAPKMGAVPHLPVPPPHKMRAEEATEGGEDQPLDGNSGNALPLQLLQLPLAIPEATAVQAGLPGTGALMMPPSGGQSVKAPAGDLLTDAPAAPDRRNQTTTVEIPAEAARQVAPSDSPAAGRGIEQIMRELAAGSGDHALPTAPRTNTAEHSSPVTGRAPLPAQTTPSLPPTASLPPPTAAGFAPRVIARDAFRSGAPAAWRERPSSHVSQTRGVQTSFEASAFADRSGGSRPLSVDTPVANLLREVTFEKAAPDTDPAQPFTLAAAAAGTAPPPSATTTARADAPVLTLPTPVANPEWADAMGERVVWLTDNNINNAQIRLNPAHLGPVEVRVALGEDQTSVSFVAHHAATREALEAAAPRLREMLASQGFMGVSVNISHHAAGERSAQGQRQDGWVAREFGAADDQVALVGARTRRSSATLDAYA